MENWTRFLGRAAKHLTGAGLSNSYAALIARLYVSHNAGMIDAEYDVGEIRRGHTTIREVIERILKVGGTAGRS